MIGFAPAVRTSLVLASAVLGAWPTLGSAAETPRVASINVCTDQLVLAIADPEQILGLSPASRDAARSWAAAEASRYRRLSGEAEDVLVLKPDFVVAGPFTRRATREFLRQHGVRVEEFDVATSIDDVKAQIRRMGDLLGRSGQAVRVVARIDAAVERARAAASRARYRVLAVSRRGWVAGSQTLVASLLVATGLVDEAGELGVSQGGFVPLEQILVAKPDLLLVASDSDAAEDQGQAFLLHPALQRLYPPAKRLIVPERLTVCGGPMIVEALERLTAEIERVSK